MPIFDFKCKDCGHTGEVMASYSRSLVLNECPQCVGSNYIKVMPSKPPHVTFRGHGWTGRIK